MISLQYKSRQYYCCSLGNLRYTFVADLTTAVYTERHHKLSPVTELSQRFRSPNGTWAFCSLLPRFSVGRRCRSWKCEVVSSGTPTNACGEVR